MENKKYKILVTDGLAREGIAILEGFKEFSVDVKQKLSREELIKIIPSYDAIIVRSATSLTSDVIAVAKNLKVIARAGTGYDNIDADACTKRGIVVLITPMGNSNAVIELTMGFMLDAARHISLANSTMCKDLWEKKRLEGTELKGKTAGIIGLGRIGAGVAKRCQAFEMKVLGHDTFIPKKRAEELGVVLVDDLNELLERSDYISIHIPLTSQTRNFIGKEQLSRMKKNAVLINVSRGEVVDEKALHEALVEKRIGGACLDVYSKEPACKADFPFIGLDNVITTPHLGASTVEAQIEVAKMAADHVAKALLSKVFIDAVNIPFQISERMAEIYKPYMELGVMLGRFMSQFEPGRYTEVGIKYKGAIFENFDPIKSTILHALFMDRFSENVTLMNVDKIIKDNGINIIVEKYDKPVNFETIIKLHVKTDTGARTEIAGTAFSDKPRIIEINELYLELAPAEYLLALVNNDRPGVIGSVGTLLGKNNINIAGWQLGRREKGEKALAIITIDDVLPAAVMEELLKLPNVMEARVIRL
ncbi:MAG: phosphoglycerate dehydrogenase [Candidatus Lokiarchaeota archaeon]|nr:phosphoglycerate dehydrogenase [Candidatus Lokiarchaeota archaeon]